jgi:leucyl aminopeptidase (aminopeptidase T)
MVGVTPRIMCEGMRADYRLVDRLSQQLCERMRSAASLTVRTPGGTDFRARFDPALVWVKTSGLINPRYWSNLPAGEVFTTPASVDGVFVCDGTAGDYFNAKYGSLEHTPLTLEVRAGRLVSAACARADLERDFRAGRAPRAGPPPATSGRTATPTSTATGSASSPSAPTSVSAR